MKLSKISTVAVVVTCLTVWARAEEHRIRQAGLLSFSFENDTFAGTDGGFTGGHRLHWMSRYLDPDRRYAGLRWLPFRRGPDYRHAVSLTIGQSGYTPDDLARSDLIAGDRPYAGFLYTAFGAHSVSDRHFQSWELLVGIVGPHAYAEDTQTFLHDLLGQIRPRGWRHQLKDELALGIFFENIWRALSWKAGRGFGIELLPQLGGSLGNVYTYAHAGMQIRLGWNIPQDFGSDPIHPGGNRSQILRERGPSGIHVFVSADGKAILRNIFLDGNTILSSHSVEKEPYTADFAVGLAFRSGRWNLSYAYVFWTKKFQGEKRNQIVGAFTLSYSY